MEAPNYKGHPIFYNRGTGIGAELIPEPGQISDGYHTFNDLYAHRNTLLIGWMNTLVLLQPYFDSIANQVGAVSSGLPWKSKLHHDGTSYEGWFIAGMDVGSKSITYHLPISDWDLLKAEELERAPEWDGHTSADVLQRLREAWEEE